MKKTPKKQSLVIQGGEKEESLSKRPKRDAAKNAKKKIDQWNNFQSQVVSQSKSNESSRVSSDAVLNTSITYNNRDYVPRKYSKSTKPNEKEKGNTNKNVKKKRRVKNYESPVSAIMNGIQYSSQSLGELMNPDEIIESYRNSLQKRKPTQEKIFNFFKPIQSIFVKEIEEEKTLFNDISNGVSNDALNDVERDEPTSHYPSIPTSISTFTLNSNSTLQNKFNNTNDIIDRSNIIIDIPQKHNPLSVFAKENLNSDIHLKIKKDEKEEIPKLIKSNENKEIEKKQKKNRDFFKEKVEESIIGFEFYGKTDREIQSWFSSLEERNKPILLIGPSGMGKTTCLERFAKKTQRKLISVDASQVKPKGLSSWLHDNVSFEESKRTNIKNNIKKVVCVDGLDTLCYFEKGSSKDNNIGWYQSVCKWIKTYSKENPPLLFTACSKSKKPIREIAKYCHVLNLPNPKNDIKKKWLFHLYAILFPDDNLSTKNYSHLFDEYPSLRFAIDIESRDIRSLTSLLRYETINIKNRLSIQQSISMANNVKQRLEAKTSKQYSLQCPDENILFRNQNIFQATKSILSSKVNLIQKSVLFNYFMPLSLSLVMKNFEFQGEDSIHLKSSFLDDVSTFDLFSSKMWDMQELLYYFLSSSIISRQSGFFYETSPCKRIKIVKREKTFGLLVPVLKKYPPILRDNRKSFVIVSKNLHSLEYRKPLIDTSHSSNDNYNNNSNENTVEKQKKPLESSIMNGKDDDFENFTLLSMSESDYQIKDYHHVDVQKIELSQDDYFQKNWKKKERCYNLKQIQRSDFWVKSFYSENRFPSLNQNQNQKKSRKIIDDVLIFEDF